ncbi:MAG: tetratricopeptide repeat protein [Acidobacteriota bacterium]|nr:tetratricopeptide repeat protein [Acidobacteriota bacterium]
MFESCYETEAKRRSYIESIIERKQPSVGYIVLANLIKYGYLKTIITTNFDSLISLACSNYTDIFPVVYSLGNFASEMTVSSERPRILKIHGDFLFSKLKNTTKDLSKPDENMERQVTKILEEYDGIIIVGYSGNDNSVMSIFESMPAGKTIYWCDLTEDSISQRAKKFLEKKGGTFVKIEGFDELMQVIRILVELDNESITKTFQDRQIEINKKLSEFEDVMLVDEETKDELENKDKTDFSIVLDKSREITQLLIAGNQAYEDGNYNLAEESYRKAIELNPNFALAYGNLGLSLVKDESRLKEAEESYRKAIELDPNFADAYISLGNLLLKDESRLKEAEESYRKAIELNPVYALAYSNLGILLFKDATRLKEAEESYRKAIELNPNFADTYYNLGVLLAEDKSRYVEAEESYRKAIQLDPNHANAYYNLGNLLFKDATRLKEAEESYRKAIELNPNFASVYYNLGVVIAEDKSRYVEAEESYRKAIQLDPNHANAYHNLGNLLFKNTTRFKEAEESYRKAIELNPNFALAYGNLGLLLAKDESRLKEAEESYRKAIELDASYVDNYSNLGNLLYKQRKIEEAKKIFKTSVELDTSRILPNLGLAAIFKKQGNQKESEKYAGQVKTLIKEDDYYNLACLNSIIDKKNESFKYLKLAIEKNPNYKSMARTDPDFEWICDDDRFLEIVGIDDEK